MVQPTIRELPVPLETDEHGTIRVGGTRVTLETVLAAFHEGYSADEIAQQYPTLALADVHATIAYFLRNRDELDNYLRAVKEHEAAVYEEIDRRHPPGSIRARLLARQRERGP